MLGIADDSCLFAEYEESVEDAVGNDCRDDVLEAGVSLTFFFHLFCRIR